MNFKFETICLRSLKEAKLYLNLLVTYGNIKNLLDSLVWWLLIYKINESVEYRDIL